jgi:predicted small secreted protein
LAAASKERVSGQYYRDVYFRLTVVSFFIETASFENSVQVIANPAQLQGAHLQESPDMKKTIAAFAAVATIAASLAATPANAQRGFGAAVAGGIIGGAIVGGAIAASRPAPVYVEGVPPPAPGCYWTRQRFWDGYAWQFRPVQVCG